MYCEYFQATVPKEKIWFVSACLRAEAHVAFMRAVDGSDKLLEFFVPKGQLDRFLSLMETFKSMGLLYSFEKMPNRIAKI